MLSGVKFIPRDQVNKAGDENLDDSIDKRKKSSRGKDKHKRKNKSLHHSNSSDDGLERIKKGSRRKKKWYSSEEYSSEGLDGSEAESSSGEDDNEVRKRRRGKRRNRGSSDDDDGKRSKRSSRSGKRNYLLEEYLSSDSERASRKRSGKGRRKKVKEGGEKEEGDDLSDDGRTPNSTRDVEIARKEMGLDWMLKPAVETSKRPVVTVDDKPEEPCVEEKVNPRELNPYLKNNGSGYPDETDEKRGDGGQLPSSSIVGDGGASWRLKALKRAQEQAAREGRKLEEVVEERWGSLGQLAVSAASHRAAPSLAHLHAIKNRKRGLLAEENETTADGQSKGEIEKKADRGYLKDLSVRHPEMRAPKVHDSLSWGKRRDQNMSTKDAGVISAAASSLNKFANDGNFMNAFFGQQNNSTGGSTDLHANQEINAESSGASPEVSKASGGTVEIKEASSANQLAAKALQLRMKGKHEEAERLMQEAEKMKAKQSAGENLGRPLKAESTKRYVIHDVSTRRKEEDADRHLAQQIIHNKQYSLSGRADDEYDFEDGPSRKSRKKGRDSDHKGSEKNIAKRIVTQQERCLFCFENPNRPKHLVMSIANFTYLMLPMWQSVVPGHCCILPLQHESATRTVDNNVWEEIRNFKKCLIMMFSKQEKDVVFLETVMGLAQQRRHCLIECIPLPREIAKQAPLYFKKAIDEAEDEWSQHNAKKLIDTSVKGLRASIPKDFPYFHVEFGLNKGFVHVIDDEKQFKGSLGLNVIRGMLRLPEEDMYRRRRHDSMEVQKQAVSDFAHDWEPFDWTKQLD